MHFDNTMERAEQEHFMYKNEEANEKHCREVVQLSVLFQRHHAVLLEQRDQFHSLSTEHHERTDITNLPA